MIPALAAALLLAALARRGDSVSQPPASPDVPALQARTGADAVIAKFRATPGGLLGSIPLTVGDVRQKGTAAGKTPLASYNPVAEAAQEASDGVMAQARGAFKSAKLEWLFDWVNDNARWLFSPIFLPDLFEVLAGGRIRPDNELLKSAPADVLDRLRAEGRLA